MGDLVRVGFIVTALPLLGIILVSWLLHYFVALTSPPNRRAAWTAGTAYALVVVLSMFAVPENYWWGAPLAAMPGGLIAYWWWRDDFRRDWIDDSRPLGEEVELANDDWRVGLIFVASIIAMFALRVLWRLALNGQL